MYASEGAADARLRVAPSEGLRQTVVSDTLGRHACATGEPVFAAQDA